MKAMNRRELIRSSIGAATTLSVMSKGKTVGANDKIIIGMMGLGGRGTKLAEFFSQRSDVEIAYLADPDTSRFARIREAVEENQTRKPKLTQDFRHILDDKDVDVLINATPDHWHALGTIMACQAGKDVFVEKPMAHNIYEGQKMIEAARKYKRVVQVDTQSRSAPYVKNAKDYVQSGGLGDVYFVRVYNMMKHGLRPETPAEAVPPGLDYDMWCGPAPKLPYTPSRRWLNQWEYSCGPIAGDAIHQIDLARFLLGDIPYPDSAVHAGGVNALLDGRQTPDTQIVTFEYGKLTFMLEAALWMPYMKKTPSTIRDSDKFPNWPFSSTKVEVFGTKGCLYLSRHGGGWVAFDADGEVVKSEYGRQADELHHDNFLECVRTRQRPIADVEIGHQSVMLCHLANISYRLGNQKLLFDGKNQKVTNSDEANKLFKRESYREPWIVPAEV